MRGPLSCLLSCSPPVSSSNGSVSHVVPQVQRTHAADPKRKRPVDVSEIDVHAELDDSASPGADESPCVSPASPASPSHLSRSKSNLSGKASTGSDSSPQVSPRNFVISGRQSPGNMSLASFRSKSSGKVSANSETKSNYSGMTAPQLQKELTEDASEGGHVSLTLDEVSALVRNVRKKESRISNLRQCLLFACGIVILLFCVNLVTSIIGSEFVKESHVRDGVLTSISGEPVGTVDVQSLSMLFDLPHFDIRTLSEVEHLTLHLDGGAEVTFQISGAFKPCPHVVKFLTVSGEAVVDSLSMVAYAKVLGERYIVKDVSGRSQSGRALASKSSRRVDFNNTSPRLYSDAEFFTAEHGFGDGRRLREDSNLGGWASLGIIAAQAKLDTAQISTPVYSSIFIAGTLVTLSGPDKDAEVHAQVFFNNTERDATRIRLGNRLTDYKLHMAFDYDSKGTLQRCGAAPDRELSYSESPADLELREVSHQAAQCGTLFIGTADDGTEFLFKETKLARFDVERDIVLPLPSAAQCAGVVSAEPERSMDTSVPVNADPSNLTLPRTRTRGRRLWGSAAASDQELWQAARGSYWNRDPASPWKVLARCEVENSIAKFMYLEDRGIMVLGFSGTDGFTQLRDWFANANIWHQEGDWGKIHRGVYKYVMKIYSCITGHEDRLAAEGIPTDYYVGHSLGGAAATAYYLIRGGGARLGVHTFGAFKTTVGTSCNVPGKRIAHSSDGVASNFMGWLGSFNHDISTSVKAVDKCTRSCWFLGCVKWEQTLETVDPSKCDWLSSGCSYLADCLYYGATIHNQYGEYL